MCSVCGWWRRCDFRAVDQLQAKQPSKPRKRKVASPSKQDWQTGSEGKIERQGKGKMKKKNHKKKKHREKSRCRSAGRESAHHTLLPTAPPRYSVPHALLVNSLETAVTVGQDGRSEGFISQKSLALVSGLSLYIVLGRQPGTQHLIADSSWQSSESQIMTWQVSSIPKTLTRAPTKCRTYCPAGCADCTPQLNVAERATSCWDAASPPRTEKTSGSGSAQPAQDWNWVRTPFTVHSTYLEASGQVVGWMGGQL